MRKERNFVFVGVLLFGLTVLTSCGGEEEPAMDTSDVTTAGDVTATGASVEEVFGDRLRLDDPFNYANQGTPSYIREDNTGANEIEDEIATLGRVLFYDKNLSVDNTISCASCHQQALGFGDDAQLSEGVAGVTGRHSMRLINARFADEERFFWDERASTLEEQTTMPIQDHIEMGFSGTEGDPDINDLINKLQGINYMNELFTYAFGDATVTEERMQFAIAQFVRSIQSFDSRYDEGRELVNDDDDDFPNFTAIENMGKALYMGRAGCDRCHQAPEFDITGNSDNNGVITVAGDPNAVDTDVTRAPTLRDIFNSEGALNGPMMHDGSFRTFVEVLAHYNDVEIDPDNNNLDRRLRGGRGGNGGPRNGGDGQNLNLSTDDVQAIIAFVKTLSGSNVYTDERWSDPFTE